MKAYRIHPETGERLTRGVRPQTVRYKGLSRTVDVPGWYPKQEDGDGVLVGADMEPIGQALRELKAELGEVIPPSEVRSVRLRLKLSQRKAGEILGGGPHAFQKYESGEVTVSKPMAQLLRLLNRDPRRLKELMKNQSSR